ncbi:hypothetical protein CBP33_08650 [Acidovorax carolinensis]|nr:hypothetical protein CBP33_08650 [Acidovorax carolinensis]
MTGQLITLRLWSYVDHRSVKGLSCDWMNNEGIQRGQEGETAIVVPNGGETLLSAQFLNLLRIVREK